MKTITRAQGAFDETPMTWRPLKQTDGTWSAVMVCECSHKGTLDTHIIKPDGSVVPSVICPIETCDFHDTVVLDGWQQFIAREG